MEGTGKVLLTLFSMLVIGYIGVEIDSIIVILCAFIPLIVLIAYNRETAKGVVEDTIEQFKNTLDKNEFKATAQHIGDNQLCGIAIDEINNKIGILRRIEVKKEFDLKVLPFSSVFESEVSQDGETLIKTSRGSQIGGALVGGALMGGTGAIIGGLSGAKTSSTVVKKIDLNITIDNLSNPIETINFLDHPTPLKKDSPTYSYTLQEAEKWHKMFSIIIKRNESNKETV
ncbi:hypothetical protein [Rossellomorea marisflavi]|uniref:hypothetical protein n=1 Tax=Rossellomorea marisflavi TaxID=189381 RepID=UPI00345D6F72